MCLWDGRTGKVAFHDRYPQFETLRLIPSFNGLGCRTCSLFPKFGIAVVTSARTNCCGTRLPASHQQSENTLSLILNSNSLFNKPTKTTQHGGPETTEFRQKRLCHPPHTPVLSSRRHPPRLHPHKALTRHTAHHHIHARNAARILDPGVPR